MLLRCCPRLDELCRDANETTIKSRTPEVKQCTPNAVIATMVGCSVYHRKAKKTSTKDIETRELQAVDSLEKYLII